MNLPSSDQTMHSPVPEVEEAQPFLNVGAANAALEFVSSDTLRGSLVLVVAVERLIEKSYVSGAGGAGTMSKRAASAAQSSLDPPRAASCCASSRYCSKPAG